jgi:hypothetical protein
MKGTANHIVVRCDKKQNASVIVGGKELLTQKRYNDNFRERNPCVGEIIDGIGDLRTGLFIVCNYSHFSDSSPYLLYDDLYSIPVNSSIIGKVGEDGSLSPVCGNVFIKNITKPSLVEIPKDFQKVKVNHGIVEAGEGWVKGQEIFFYNYSNYEVVYTWKGVEHRCIKIENEEIVGFIKE